MAVKYFLKENVYIKAKERIEYLYGEFDDVVVGFSGGKDSTVCLNLTIEVARKLNRLPVKAVFIDQEAEWEQVIEYVRRVQDRKEVEMLWFQIPLRLHASISNTDDVFVCWESGAKWIRKKEPNSIHDNTYDEYEALSAIMTAIFTKDMPNNTCYIGGVRAEESPRRTMALTENATYKHITWGRITNKLKNQYTFYPLYDWSYTDIWKAIHDNNWDYCTMYDEFYKMGRNPKDMRVSSLLHEFGIKDLPELATVSTDLWLRLQERVKGIHTSAEHQDILYKAPKQLPFMFKSWRDYRDYIRKTLVAPEQQPMYEETARQFDNAYTKGTKIDKDGCRAVITSMLINDKRATMVNQFWKNPDVNNYRKYKEGKITRMLKPNKYLEEEYGSIIYSDKK